MLDASRKYDVLLIGGGVIGLSLAWELAQAGTKVCLIDQGDLGHEASWAASGMIPPGPSPEVWGSCTAIEQLATLSESLHPQWHEHLLDSTGIDNGYRRTGAIHLSDDTKAKSQPLSQKVENWTRLGIEHRRLDSETLRDIAVGLSPAAVNREAVFLPGEAQVRSPWHLRALIAACKNTGVELCSGVAVEGFNTAKNRIESAQTSGGTIHAAHFCLTAGCWVGLIAERLGLKIPTRPVLGQILLLDGPPGLVRHITNVGRRYVTPRPDGRLLVGSTEEEVGYHKRNTVAGLAGLAQFASDLYPAVSKLTVECSWSGLRPGTPDELPAMGPLLRFDNAWIAAGHFRGGIQLSPATAQVMCLQILGEQPVIDTSSLGVERFGAGK